MKNYVDKNGLKEFATKLTEKYKTMFMEVVTPQMFGAKGDGTTDDSAAIQAAINDGRPVFFPPAVYAMASSVSIADKNTGNMSGRFTWGMNASNARFEYSGNSYAFTLSHIFDCNIHFGTIYSSNGGCVAFSSSSSDDASQYVNISFTIMRAAESFSCILASETTGGWVNEIRINNGRFASGTNGIEIKNNVVNRISGWRIHEVGFEGVTNCVKFSGTAATNGFIFTNCRYAESFTYFINSDVVIDYIYVVGTNSLTNEKLILPSGSTGFIVSPAIINNGNNTQHTARTARIVGGKLISDYEESVLNILSSNTNSVLDLSTYDTQKMPRNIYVNSTATTTINLNDCFGRIGGINEFYFRFAATPTAQAPFTIKQGDTIIKTFTDGTYTGKLIKARWIEKYVASLDYWQFTIEELI